jgi:tetratricopeptide (TPR) repeat protein
MRQARGGWLAVAMVLAAGSVSGGDPDVADLLFKKAKKAFAAKDYAEAESGFRRALKEMSPFPDARLGLAESLEKLARPREAIEQYRTCVDEIDAAGAPAKWKPMMTRARQALARLQGRQAELAKINDAFIRKYIDFARKRAATDPLWARKALDTVLRLDASNEVARGMLAKLPAASPPKPAEPSEPERRGPNLFRRKCWDGAPEWSVEADTITGDVPGRDGKLFWLEEEMPKGTYTIRGRFRLTRDGGDRRAYGVFFGGDGKANWWALILSQDEEIVLERFDNSVPRRVAGPGLEGFDHTAWHTLEIRVRPGDVRVRLDEREPIQHLESERTAFDGKIALFVQNACIEWKELEVGQ